MDARRLPPIFADFWLTLIADIKYKYIDFLVKTKQGKSIERSFMVIIWSIKVQSTLSVSK